MLILILLILKSLIKKYNIDNSFIIDKGITVTETMLEERLAG